IVGIEENGQLIAQQKPGDNQLWAEVLQRAARASEIYQRIQDLEGGAIGALNYELEQLRLEQRRLQLQGQDTPQNLAELQAQRAVLQAEYASQEAQLMALYTPFKRDTLLLQTAD